MEILDFNTEAIRKLCREAHMTQRELAVKIGIHPVTLSQKLNREKMFTEEEIEKIARTFNKKFVIG